MIEPKTCRAQALRLPKVSFRHFLLPVLPIPRRHIDAPHIVPLKAPAIDGIISSIAPRYRQGRDATGFAEHVSRNSRSEHL